MIDYAQILAENYSDKLWSLSGDSYDGLDWTDLSPKPTQDELDNLWESTKTAIIAKAEAESNAKQSALAKLAALGLTKDEIKALVG